MIKYTISKYMYGFPSKIAAANGADHIYNIRLTADTPNMTIVGRGDWVGFDEYAQAAAPQGFAGVIREQAANGNWYIEVTTPAEALLVYDSPIIAEDYNKEFEKEENFFNEKGKTVKAYSLTKGDIFEVSESGFDKTPVVGKAVSFVDGEYAVAS